MRSRLAALFFIGALAAIVSGVSIWSEAARSSASGGPGIISVGYDHTCALLDTGGVKCFGSNASGQLGDGTTASTSLPVDVCGVGGCGAQLSGVRSVSSGREHNCVLTTGGGVKCWGANTLMQLGNGANENSNVPVNVTGLSSSVAQLSAGRYSTCVVTVSGGAKCWGSNFYGQLGDGTNADHGVPMDVSGLQSGAASVETERYHACAVMAAGTVKCWGDNVDGQLGNPGVAITNQPIDVCADNDCSALLQNVAAVSLGLHSTCALMGSGGVKCWGKNDFGQLGNGTMASSGAPVDVYGLSIGVAAISVGEANVCALMVSTQVKCWGDNRFGQLGNGTTIDNSYPSELCADSDCLSPLSGAATVSAGSHQACALLSNGGVKCWGLNSTGQLGDGTTTGRVAPVDTLLSGVKSVPTSTRTPTATRTPTRTPTPPAILLGDANCDGRVDSIDAALILQYSAGLLRALNCQQGGDVNRDGHINSIDSALILQYIAGLLDEFP